MPQFYIDSTDFSSATGIYTDALFTTPAPDGYYASCGVVRRQLNGSLLPYTECIDCKNYERPVEGELLLDLYPDAAVAYSLDQLKTSYEGSAVRVRRASDNTEQDIGFVDMLLDTSALATFCAGTDGYIVRVYDQSGNGNDAVQATTSAQPQIVVSGAVSLDPDTGLPAMKFNGSSTSLQNSAFSSLIAAPNFAFGVVNFQSTVNQYYTDTIATGRSATGVISGNYSVRGVSAGAASTGVVLMTSEQLATAAKLYVNGSQGFSLNNSTLITWSNVILGTGQVGLYLNGYLSGFILYNSDQSANRTGIESNINARYQIYWDGSQTALLDTYPNAAVAYSLEALNSAYTGPIVRVRRASDNAESDITALYDGSLNVSALEAFCAGTNGYVVRWYDQSGNGNNAVQATTSRQPQIYDSATGIILENGKPAITPNLANCLVISSFSGNSTAYIFAVARANLTNTSNLIQGNGGNQYLLVSQDASTSTGINGGSGTVGYYIDGTATTFVDRDDVHTVMSNKRVLTITADTSGYSAYAFGYPANPGSITMMQMSECIIYHSDQSANRTGIEADINARYNMYWDGSQPALLDSYPLASAAYSLRALNSDYVGPLIRVRRASDNAEQDISALYDGSLNVSALEAFCAGTDGYVARWHDQSGAGNDAVQASTSVQPQIVASGSVLLNSNSLPCAVFNGAQYLSNTSPTASALKYVSFVSEDNVSTGTSLGAYVAQNVTGVNYANQLLYSTSSNTTTINGRSNSNGYIGVSASGYKKIVVGFYDYASDVLNGNFDGVTATPTSGLTDTSTSIIKIEIGANSLNSVFSKMRIQEFIIWTSGTYDIDTLADVINADYNLF